MKKNNKAMVQVSLSWVFMIIIGTFFLIFAYNVIDKYQEIETQKNDLELKNALRNILNDVGRTAGIESSSIRSIGNIFQDSKVEIFCEDDIPILSINNKADANNEYLKNYPVFMTNIEENKISSTFIAVESFRMPFKISNLLAIISKKNLLVFDSKSSISEEFIKKFKRGSYSQLSRDSFDFEIDISSKISSYNSKNLNSIIFIADLDREPIFDTNIFKDLNTEVSLILIDKTSPKTGILKYVYLDSLGVVVSSDDYEYIDFDESLSIPTMALFSRPSTFECSYNLLAKQVKPIYNFYVTKVSNFLEMGRSGGKKVNLCSDSLSYFDVNNKYETFKNSLNQVLNLDFENDKFKYSENEIIGYLSSIEDNQRDLEKFSCLYVY